MSDTTTAPAAADAGVFSAEQVEILTARKTEPDWLRERRLAAHGVFAATPMPTTEPEEWRYTEIARILDLDAFELAGDATPAASRSELPAALREAMERVGAGSGTVVQADASVIHETLDEGVGSQGVVFTSLERAAREHPELVRDRLGAAATPEIGKFSALNAALWTGGLFLYVPKGVRVEAPLRFWQWLGGSGTAVLPRILVVAEENAEVTLVTGTVSESSEARGLSVGATEVFAGENARVTLVQEQGWGRGVVHLTTERFVAGRDARITTLNLALGADVARSDVQCRMDAPGAHVDLLGLYLSDATQHVDFQTLQDHVAPHASSNLLFKGSLQDESRSVFRGMIRVHKGAQRTDAYQTNRNLLLSERARADSLPNLEIEADDVRCSHAATVGQLDQEEIFYLRSRGIPLDAAIRLVIFGFFGEVLDQLPDEEIRKELTASIERKLAARRAAGG
jgi:Fe-S cluster assembly protein SufD